MNDHLSRVRFCTVWEKSKTENHRLEALSIVLWGRSFFLSVIGKSKRGDALFKGDFEFLSQKIRNRKEADKKTRDVRKGVLSSSYFLLSLILPHYNPSNSYSLWSKILLALKFLLPYDDSCHDSFSNKYYKVWNHYVFTTSLW